MIHPLALHPSDQPLFSLAVRAAGCVLDLRINDVPVFREISGGAVDAALPINEWLFRGENEIQCRLHPLGSPSARVHVELQHRRLRQPHKHAVRLATMRWEAVDFESSARHFEAQAERPSDSSTMTTPGTVTEFIWQSKAAARLPNEGWALAGGFSLPVPWAPCPWEKGAMLSEQPNLKFSLWHLTQEFWGVLAGRDPAAIQRLTTTRAMSLESAYHLAGGELDEALLFPRLLQRPEWKLAPLPDEGWTLEVASGGRLGRIVDENHGDSVLRLINETEGTEAIIDAWWAFTHRWVLVA